MQVLDFLLCKSTFWVTKKSKLILYTVKFKKSYIISISWFAFFFLLCGWHLLHHHYCCFKDYANLFLPQCNTTWTQYAKYLDWKESGGMFFEMTSRYYIAVECSLYLSSKENNNNYYYKFMLLIFELNCIALKCNITSRNFNWPVVIWFQALYLLLQCNYVVEDAIGKRKSQTNPQAGLLTLEMSPFKSIDPMHKWLAI